MEAMNPSPDFILAVAELLSQVFRNGNLLLIKLSKERCCV